MKVDIPDFGQQFRRAPDFPRPSLSRWLDVHHKRDLAAAVVAVLWMIFLLWIYPVLR